jgi:hypothetical protein
MKPYAFALSIALSVPATAFAQRSGVPRPVVDLKPGTANYKVRLEVAGQVATMDITRITKSQNGRWLVTETSWMDGHSQTDETTLEKKTLIIRSRVFRAESAVADLKFDGQKATGTITDGKEKHVVDADVGGVIFADGASGGDVMAALPLAKNYSAEFRNFNIGSEQVRQLQLRVIDSETVLVPAGTFDTWKVLITSLDGGSDSYALWVEKRTHRVVKMAVSVPNMRDALATAELTK